MSSPAFALLRATRPSARLLLRPTFPTLLPARRQLHSHPRQLMPYKDDQDRESLKPRPSEGTKSGSDNDVADQTQDAAWNPNKTRPGKEMDSAEQELESDGGKGNPLEVSGANQELSKPQGDNPGAEHAKKNDHPNQDKQKRSGGSRGPKKGKTSAA